ncbi:amino acid carrier protein [Eubacteriales bacterium OttesenSCG-928-G02]|nr:amino acid carrier protein [Eubacteriales bacterium OttesenSCG-928-G02]
MLTAIKELLWGAPTVTVIFVCGLYFSVKSRFIQLFGWKKIIKSIKSTFKTDSKTQKGISSFAALSTALGGTVGIGSIVGVGLALSIGGSGSIFWMWVSGFIGTVIKYAEVYSSVKYRKKIDGIYVGGTMYCLQSEGKNVMAKIFAVLCIMASYGVGNMTQASAVSELLGKSGVSEYICGILMAGLIGYTIFGGQKRIAKISEALVPAASIIYLLFMVAAMVMLLPVLPSVFAEIFQSAFGIKQFAGGTGGTIIALSMRVGMTRGIFSNEAGMGSSPIAHAAAENANPQNQGAWGIVEVVVDIFVFSTMTGIALIGFKTTDVGAMFSHVFGVLGTIILPILLVIFAFASIISWCYYSESCIKFLFPGKYSKVSVLYSISVVICTFVGAVSKASSVWDAADILNVCMIIPNLYMLFLKRKDIDLCLGI